MIRAGSEATDDLGRRSMNGGVDAKEHPGILYNNVSEYRVSKLTNRPYVVTLIADFISWIVRIVKTHARSVRRQCVDLTFHLRFIGRSLSLCPSRVERFSTKKIDFPLFGATTKSLTGKYYTTI